MYLGTILYNRKYLCRDIIFYGIPQNYMPSQLNWNDSGLEPSGGEGGRVGSLCSARDCEHETASFL